MRDRTPQYPGRVRLTHVSGDLYDLQMADQPEEAGTPLNKATLLQDSTAAMFGLGADAVPDDIFRAMPHAFYQYHWRRRVNRVDVTQTPVTSTAELISGSSSSPLTVMAGTELDVYNHRILNPQAISGLYNQLPQLLAGLAPCYISKETSPLEVIYLPSGSTAGTTSSSTIYNTTSGTTRRVYLSGVANIKAENVAFADTIGEWEIVSAYDRDAYPDSGIVDGYEYNYFGYGKDHIARLAVDGVSLATGGTYIGTGAYGAGRPNRIVFESPPKIVVVRDFRANYNYGFMMLVNGIEGAIVYCAQSASSSDLIGSGVWDHNVTFSGNEVVWFSVSSAQSQGNRADTEYAYFALL